MSTAISYDEVGDRSIEYHASFRNVLLYPNLSTVGNVTEGCSKAILRFAVDHTGLAIQRIEDIRRSRSKLQFDEWPNSRAFFDAIRFAKSLRGMDLLPTISVADDGELNFLWDSGTLHVDLGFYGDGSYSYYARDAEGKEFFGDNVPCSHLPSDLSETLGIDP